MVMIGIGTSFLLNTTVALANTVTGLTVARAVRATTTEDTEGLLALRLQFAPCKLTLVPTFRGRGRPRHTFI